MEYYEGLHERVMKNSFNVVIDTNPEIVQSPDQSIESESAPTDELEVTTLNEECQSISTEEVLNLLTNTFENLKILIDHSDKAFKLGVKKFASKVLSMSTSSQTSALHCFRNECVTYNKVGRSSVLKRGNRGKIYVQPEAVQRRKFKNGSRSVQSTGKHRTLNDIPVSSTNAMRVHKLADNVRENVPASKKAGKIYDITY